MSLLELSARRPQNMSKAVWSNQNPFISSRIYSDGPMTMFFLCHSTLIFIILDSDHSILKVGVSAEGDSEDDDWRQGLGRERASLHSSPSLFLTRCIISGFSDFFLLGHSHSCNYWMTKINYNWLGGSWVLVQLVKWNHKCDKLISKHLL